MGRKLLWASLVLAPITILLRYAFHVSDTALFVAAAAALVPLAWLIGEATEHAGEHTGPGIGGFLNASFGNAPELIIALFAVERGAARRRARLTGGQRGLEHPAGAGRRVDLRRQRRRWEAARPVFDPPAARARARCRCCSSWCHRCRAGPGMRSGTRWRFSRFPWRSCSCSCTRRRRFAGCAATSGCTRKAARCPAGGWSLPVSLASAGGGDGGDGADQRDPRPLAPLIRGVGRACRSSSSRR